MPAELVVLLVGIGCTLLGGFGTWWIIAIPTINANRRDVAEQFAAMTPDQVAFYRDLFAQRRESARRQAALERGLSS